MSNREPTPPGSKTSPTANPLKALPTPVAQAQDEDEGELEQALIERARGGEAEAFGLLVARHQRAAYGLALRLLGSAEPARDVCQEAFVKAWSARERFEAGRAFAPWLLTIVRRLSIDRYRRGGRWQLEELSSHHETGGRSPASTAAAGADGVLTQQLDTAALHRQLAEAVRTLPSNYQAVIELHHLQERPIAEIAEILGRPKGTIMTWLFRARAALKERLQAEGVTL